MNDAKFIELFESRDLPFSEWTHEAHVRMAYCYMSKYPIKQATQKIISGIQNYNLRHQDKIKIGYKEDITLRWIDKISRKIEAYQAQHVDFESFIKKFPELLYKII